jgi:metal-responsive CopG/Arc/MetJ family transcriptional regulator
MNTNEEESIRLSLRFSKTLLLKIDAVRQEWGLRSRSATVERLLQELFKD